MRKFILVFVVPMLLLSFRGYSEDVGKNKMRNIYLWSFLRYIEFPTDGPLKVAYVGRSSDEFTEMRDFLKIRKAQGKSIEVELASSTDDLSSYHLVYISDAYSSHIEDVKTSASSSKTVIVSERSNLIDKGAGISFFIQGNKMLFKLNKSFFDQTGLSVSSSLLNVARII